MFQNLTIPQSSPLICNPCTHSHIIITLQPIYFSLIPSQYYLRTRVVLNSNVTFSEPEEWTCLQKTSSNLLCFNHWGLSLRISQLGTIQVLTAQLKPDFRPSKCLEFVSNSRHTKALDVLRIQKRRGNQNSDLDRILMGIHEEFPWLKNRGKTIPENLLVFQKKKVMDWPCSKHGGYFVPIPWRALCGQEIFSMRIEVFSIQIENCFFDRLN